MNPRIIVKVNFLILALFLVIFFMSKAKDGGIRAGIEAMFGISKVKTSEPAKR